MKYVYRCPICKKDETFHVPPHGNPICRGPEKTHDKEMAFVPEKSEAIPTYLNKENKK